MSSKNFKNDEYIEFINNERYLESDLFTEYNGTYIQKVYLKYSDLVEKFEVRDDDIWLCHYPRSGMNNFKYFVEKIL